jgi:hypothetical protein
MADRQDWKGQRFKKKTCKAWFKRRILHVSNAIRIRFDGITKVRRLFQTSNFENVEFNSTRFKRRILHASN